MPESSMAAAFRAYQDTGEYSSARSFAPDPDNVDNALRFVFEAGWNAALQTAMHATHLTTAREELKALISKS